MDEYRLTVQALKDLAGIRQYLQEHDSFGAADHLEIQFFDAFDDLVRLSAMGHRRLDVKPSDMLFHNVSSYVVAFQREPRVVIYRVVHGARDFAKIF